jgi:serine/threonine protein phosphatase 1
MLESDADEDSFDLWMVNGGKETLKSFGTSSFGEFSGVYQEFFHTTEYYMQTNTCIFVHAGLDFMKDDPFENKEAMLWIRKFHVDHKKLGHRIIVHGHTPLPAETITMQAGPVFNIDGGCVYPKITGYGHLFALEVNRMEFFSVKNVDF